MSEGEAGPSAAMAGLDFRALFEGSPNLYLVLDPQLRIVAVNDAYCQATLTRREKIVGRGLFEVFPDNPNDAGATGVANLHASLNRVLRTRRADAIPPQKYDIPRPAGEGGGFEVRYWSPLNTPVPGPDGEVSAIIHRVEDITAFVRLEEQGQVSANTIAQLRAANDALAARTDDIAGLQRQLMARTEELQEASTFLNLVVEHIPAMIAVKDAAELRFVLLNRAGEDLTGIPRTESLGKNDYDFFPREQADFFVAQDRQVLDSDEVKVIPEEPIQTRNKGLRLLRTHKLAVPDEHGRPRYLLAMSEDITERKAAEAALRESEAMFGGLLEASPDAIMVVGPDGIIQRANERFREMYGYAPEELVGQSVAILTPPAVVEDNMNRVRRALEQQDGRSGVVQDLEGLRRDGTTFPTEAIVFGQETSRGRAFTVAIRDVSERQAVEAQLRQALKMEAIGNLTGGLAHDFNNLLGVVIGNIDLLREELEAGSSGDEFAAEALSAALRGAELTKRLLAFARRQPLQPKLIDLNDHVAGIAKLLQRTMGSNMDIVHRAGAAVWPVTADPAQLEAVLVNLVANARDAMPNGGTLSITTANRHLDDDYAGLYPGLASGDYALIEVTDTGSGIPREIVDRIFEPFFTTKADGKGTGLGLSMVFGFMKQSGGHVNVYSEVGVGTTFRLYLPRTVGATRGEAAPQEAGAVRPGQLETVLAVEDNPKLRLLVVKQLTQLGYKVLEAEDGPSALRILEAQPVDLVFSDVLMPGGMSGYDLGRVTKTRWPQIKVLLTSGFPEEKLNGNGQPPWNMRLLIKPYRKEDMARLLREVLEED